MQVPFPISYRIRLQLNHQGSLATLLIGSPTSPPPHSTKSFPPPQRFQAKSLLPQPHPQNSMRRPNLSSQIASDTYSKLCSPWAWDVIVKPCGRSFSSDYVSSSLLKIWKPIGPLRTIPTRKGYFLSSFEFKEDFVRILEKGPWFLEFFSLL